MRTRVPCRVAVIAVLAAPAALAQQPPDALRSIAALDSLAVAEATALEREVWPGYRFDSLGLMYIVPNAGKLALRWPGEPPRGMRPLGESRNEWWSDTGQVQWGPGLAVATLSVASGATPAEILGLALHEAFHAYQVTRRRDGSRFGAGENTMITATYPLFDIENEAAVAAESRLLRRAVESTTANDARRLASEFVVLREARQARLGGETVEYEKAAELHEGLPQYAMLEGLAALTERHPELRAGADLERAREAAVLDSTLGHGPRSVRRRFYATGSHIAFLLDRLASPDWKERVVRGDVWLQDLLAESVGRSVDRERVLRTVDSFIPAAARAVSDMRERRLATRDSIMSGSMRLVIDVTGASWCFFDPQNVLSTSAGELLHMRMLRLCHGDRMTAMFTKPVVEDARAGLVSTSMNEPPEITASGERVEPPGAGGAVILEDVRIQAEGIEIESKKAVLVGGVSRLMVLPLAP